MSYENYSNALSAGRKEYRARVLKGGYPYLPVLEEILSFTNVEYEVNLGVCEVPLELIVGTKTKGRTNSFAANASSGRLLGICGQMDSSVYHAGGGGSAGSGEGL